MDDYSNEEFREVINALRANAEALGRVNVDRGTSGGGPSMSPATKKMFAELSSQVKGLNLSVSGMTASFKNITRSADDLLSGIKGFLRTGIFGAAGGAVLVELFEVGEHFAKTYKNLTDIGENFGGSMLAMSKAAADANLPLDEFATMLSRNSVAAAQLQQTSGKTGASFSSLQKGVTENLKQFGMYGMSLAEVSDITGDFAETMRLSNSATYRNKQAMTDQITKFAIDISEWSAATGRSRKQLEEATNETLRSISATSLKLDAGQRVAFEKANTGLNAIDPSKQFANALNDTIAQMQHGGTVANTEFYQTMTKANPAVAQEIGEQMTLMAKKVLGGAVDNTAIDKLAENAAKTLNSQRNNLYIQAYNAKNDAAGSMIAISNEINGYQSDAAKEAREAAAKQGVITSQFLQIESNLTTVVSIFKSSILDSLQVFDGDSDKANQTMTNMFTWIDNVAAGLGKFIGGGIKYLTDGRFEKDIEPLRTALAPDITAISKSFGDLAKYLADPKDGGFNKDFESFKKNVRKDIKDISEVASQISSVLKAVDHAFEWVFGKFDNNSELSKGLAAFATGLLVFKGPALIAGITKGIFGNLTRRVDIQAGIVNVSGGIGGSGGAGGVKSAENAVEGALENSGGVVKNAEHAAEEVAEKSKGGILNLVKNAIGKTGSSIVKTLSGEGLGVGGRIASAAGSVSKYLGPIGVGMAAYGQAKEDFFNTAKPNKHGMYPQDSGMLNGVKNMITEWKQVSSGELNFWTGKYKNSTVDEKLAASPTSPQNTPIMQKDLSDTMAEQQDIYNKIVMDRKNNDNVDLVKHLKDLNENIKKLAAITMQNGAQSAALQKKGNGIAAASSIR